MTDARQSTLAREALLSDAGTVNASTIVREVLLSQVSQVWTSVVAREVLLSGGAVGAMREQCSVTINTG